MRARACVYVSVHALYPRVYAFTEGFLDGR